MASPSRLILIAAVAFVFAVASCSDDDNPTDSGTTDTTPPGVSSVTPVDAFHIDVTFSEQVTRSSAENDANYSMVEAAFPIAAASAARTASPGDPMPIIGIVLQANKKTVSITTESSMAGVSYDLSVNGVSDTHGNSITEPIQRLFTGSNTPDQTPPTIVSRSPAPNATNVPIGTPVMAQFSEALQGATPSWYSGGGPVSFLADVGATSVVLTPDGPLDYNTIYTVDMTVSDVAGNLADFQWSFTTTNTSDNTPPTLVSSTPANNATNVSVNTNLSMTFSEAVNQAEFDVSLAPDPGDGNATWSNGGKTITFDPVDPLLDDQQYILTILPGGVRDLAGNGIVGLHTVVFSTGSALENGSIAGTITGHPGTPAADPTGATVIAADASLFEDGDNLGLFGTAIVAGNDSYAITRLPDGTYYPLVIMDSNGDGQFDPSTGDAIGVYGVTSFLDITPDPVIIAGGSDATGINFPIFDPSAITGTVTYGGMYAEGFWPIFVGLFDTTGWSPTDDPVAGDEIFWPFERDWEFNSFEQMYPSDQYYVGAFMDVNENGTYDPGIDPAGMYGGIASPTPLNATNGNDFSGIVIPLADPAPGMTAASVTWPAPKHNAAFKRLCDVARRGQAMANR